MSEKKKGLMGNTEATLQDISDKLDTLLDYEAYVAMLLETGLQAQSQQNPELGISMPKSPQIKREVKK